MNLHFLMGNLKCFGVAHQLIVIVFVLGSQRTDVQGKMIQVDVLKYTELIINHHKIIHTTNCTECGTSSIPSGLCNKTCLASSSPICGTDGETYPNECLLNFQNCYGGGKIYKAYDGECQTPVTTPITITIPTTTPTTTPIATPTAIYPPYADICEIVCSNYLRPVCGTDGNTYGSECMLNCHRRGKVKKDYDGTCGTTTVSTTTFTEPTTTPLGSCYMTCLEHFTPVCGTDGITYFNACYLSVTNCYKGGNIGKAYEGKCQSTTPDPITTTSATTPTTTTYPPYVVCEMVCLDYLTPVCGTDGNTYGSECILNCHKRGKVKKAYNGSCETFGITTPTPVDPTITTPGPCDLDVNIWCGYHQNYDSVCGTNGITYSSKCHLYFDSMCKSTNVDVAYAGECNHHTCDMDVSVYCPPYYDKICGTDGKTYSSLCHLFMANTCNGTSVEKAHDGECETSLQLTQIETTSLPCLVACPDNYSPVCGTDGHTYLDECELKGKNMCDGTTIGKAYDGKCTPTTTTTNWPEYPKE